MTKGGNNAEARFKKKESNQEKEGNKEEKEDKESNKKEKEDKEKKKIICTKRKGEFLPLSHFIPLTTRPWTHIILPA